MAIFSLMSGYCTSIFKWRYLTGKGRNFLLNILVCGFLYSSSLSDLHFTVSIQQGFSGAIPNFATEKEQKRNFLDFTDVTLVVVDIKSERFVKSTSLQQDLFDMTMVTIIFDTKTSKSESFIDRSIEVIINIMMEFHHF